MKPRAALAILAATLVPLLSYCSDSSPTGVDDGSLESQVNALFPEGSAARTDAQLKLLSIREQVGSGGPSSAQPKVLELVDLTLNTFQAGQLTGGKSITTGNAVSKLVGGLYQLVGMDPPQIPDGSLGGDGTAQVVGPAGGTVVTPAGVAGVVIPPGALPAQVVVTITRLPTPTTPGTGPLPTQLKQYPPYYDYATYPAVAQFGDSLRVGLCQVTDPSSPLYPPEPHERLRLAHTVGTSIQILDRVDVSDFLKCTGVSATRSSSQSGWRGMLATVTDRVVGMVRPAELYAAHGGLGGKVKSFSPFAAVDPGPPAAALSLGVGSFHTCALNVSGAAYCWGLNGSGQLGNGTTTNSATPVPVSGGLTFSSINAGFNATCALTSRGTAYCWGVNGVGLGGGLLGNGTTANSNVPVPVSGGLSFSAISVGGNGHACALTVAGVAYCWGSNTNGQLGDGTTNGSMTPVAVVGGLTFKSISAGLSHNCALTSDGTAYCWGWNAFLQLGSGASDTRILVPTRVTGGLSFTSVTAGAGQSCGISNADAYCWGSNFFGSLGNGSTSSQSPAPGKVTGGLAFVAVETGKANDIFTPTCALTGSRAAYCWGANDTGQLGTTSALSTCTQGGSTPPFGCTGTPVPVDGSLAFDIVVPGAQHVCGLARDGRAYCWGENRLGQLGNGGSTQSNTPVAVAGGIIFP